MSKSGSLLASAEALPDLLSFVSGENEQFLFSLANDTNEMTFVGRLQALYETALNSKSAHQVHHWAEAEASVG